MNHELGEAGDLLLNVLLGPCLGGCLRFWTSDGDPQTVAVNDPQALIALLGRGELARTSPEPRRFRDVALFNPAQQTLHLLGSVRHPAPRVGQEELRVQVPLHGSFTVRVCAEPGGDTLGDITARWLGAVVVDAAARGEFRGGTAAPADHATLRAAGGLLVEAVSAWASSPLDTVLTFGATPDGPFPGPLSSTSQQGASPTTRTERAGPVRTPLIPPAPKRRH